ncbi:MAG: SpoIID/LytB domain-containing protein [Eubacteriales bacterium]|nr:SpoIID/LytB domain-containing protein [Eubacteriales bacterium]
MKRKLFAYVTGFFLLLLLPYVVTILANGMDAALLNRSLDVEVCLPAVVSLQIPKDYEMETIKTQAIIARTNLYRRLFQKESLEDILGELKEGLEENRNWHIPDGVYEEAVCQTEGQVLSFQGELKLVPYHEISSGNTRDGAEVFHDETYAYLESVDSSVDKESPDYLNSTYIAAQQMPQELEIVQTDSAGYVMSLRTEGNTLEGEAFRQGMGLSSADFSIQKIGEEFRFLCKGRGHGLGFSQYGGNELAKEGNTCAEILETYFPKMELAHISGIFMKM